MNGARNVAALLRLRRWSALPLAIVLICGAAAPGLGANGDGRPIELAVFDFELDDYSAGTSIAGDRDGDEVQLASVSSEVRKVIEQSRRYRLVDVSSTDALAAKDHSLRSCDGCDASIALALGAEQSLVGVVRRITRTNTWSSFVCGTREPESCWPARKPICAWVRTTRGAGARPG